MNAMTIDIANPVTFSSVAIELVPRIRSLPLKAPDFRGLKSFCNANITNINTNI